MMIQLEINPDSSKIPVLSLQEKVRHIFSVPVIGLHYFQGYASDSSFAQYNGTISQPLASFTFCLRLQVSLSDSQQDIIQLFRSIMRGQETISSPTLWTMITRTSCTPSTTLAGVPSEAVRKGPSSAPGTRVSRASTSGGISVRMASVRLLLSEM